MPPTLPKFDNPPLIETALRVQFDRPKDLSAAHLGAFWAQIRDEFPVCVEQPPIENRFERFGDERTFAPSGLRKIRLGGVSELRLQLSTPDKSQMVQVQHDTFVFNWIKSEESMTYPHFQATYDRFLDLWCRFNTFCRTTSVPPLQANQWEITYVNHIRRGDGWSSTADLHKLFSGLLASIRLAPGQALDDFALKWQVDLSEQRGRLHVELNHGWTGEGGNADEILLFQLIARGPITPEVDLKTGMNLGHVEVVEAFDRFTSQESHNIWQKKKS